MGQGGKICSLSLMLQCCLLPALGWMHARDGTAPPPSTQAAEQPDAVPAPCLGVTLGWTAWLSCRGLYAPVIIRVSLGGHYTPFWCHVGLGELGADLWDQERLYGVLWSFSSQRYELWAELLRERHSLSQEDHSIVSETLPVATCLVKALRHFNAPVSIPSVFKTLHFPPFYPMSMQWRLTLQFPNAQRVHASSAWHLLGPQCLQRPQGEEQYYLAEETPVTNWINSGWDLCCLNVYV